MFRRLPKFEMDQPGDDPYRVPDKSGRAGFGTILLIVGVTAAIGACFFFYLQARASVEQRRSGSASPAPAMSASPQPTGSQSPSATPTARPASSGDAPASQPETVVQTVEVEVTRQVPVTQIVNQSNTVIVTRVVPGPTIIQTEIVQVPVVQTQIVQVPVIQTVIVVVTAIPASATATASQTASPTPTLTPTATQTPTPTATETPTETATP